MNKNKTGTYENIINNMSSSTLLLSPSLEPTTISQLNDDCLFEIFKHLNHFEMSVIADTCTRFRLLAIDYFPRSTLKTVNFGYYLEKRDAKNEQKLFLVRRLVKHFGRFIVKACCCYFINEFIAPLMQCPNLIELCLYMLTISDKTASEMRPLLGRLQTLTIAFIRAGPLLWEMLPLWAAEVSYLELIYNHNLSNSKLWSANLLSLESRPQHTFRKLVKFSYSGGGGYYYFHEFNDLIKCNPQLREIEIYRDSFFSKQNYDLVLEKLPQLEKLYISYGRTTCTTGFQTHCVKMASLSKLQSLAARGSATNLQQIVHAIGGSEMPLTYLYLELHDSNLTQGFFEDIVELKRLEQLIIERGHDTKYNKDEIQIIGNLSKYMKRQSGSTTGEGSDLESAPLIFHSASTSSVPEFQRWKHPHKQSGLRFLGPVWR